MKSREGCALDEARLSVLPVIRDQIYCTDFLQLHKARQSLATTFGINLARSARTDELKAMRGKSS